MTQSNAVLEYIRNQLVEASAGSLSDRELLRRFADRHDEGAFKALLRRHGPMVLRVCRRMLPCQEDAEDVFQAAFLVLAQKSGALNWQESMGSWLCDVARRLALKARGQHLSRRAREVRAAEPGLAQDPLAEISGRELLTLLDEEVASLPERSQAALLCHLEGQSSDEAARHLGCSLRTFQARLQQARERLQKRLQRRGITLSTAALSALLLQHTASASVPAALAANTIQAVALVAAGKPLTAGVISARVLALVQGATGGGFFSKLKVFLVVLLAVAGLTAGAVALAPQYFKEKPEAEASPDKPRTKPEGEKPERADRFGDPLPEGALPAPEGVVVAGRVVDADGQPVPNARVALLGPRPQERGEAMLDDVRLVEGRADGQGQFRLTLPPRQLPYRGRSPLKLLKLLAASEDGQHAVRALALPAWESSEPLEARLAPALSLVGRLVDERGKPAAGVRLRIVQIQAAIQGAAAQPADPVSFWPRPVVTDAVGQFTIQGLDPDRGGLLSVEDERFTPQLISLTWLAPPKEGRTPAATFCLQAARYLEGCVRAEDTGRPLPHARLRLWARGAASPSPPLPHNGGEGLKEQTLDDSDPTIPLPKQMVDRVLQDVEGHLTPAGNQINAQADAAGRYRVAVPSGELVRVEVTPADEEPYLAFYRELAWPPGKTRQELNLALPRGVRVRLAVTEAETGKPLSGVYARYVAQEGEGPPPPQGVLNRPENGVVGGADGVVRLTVPAGRPGHLLVRAPLGAAVPRLVDGGLLQHGRPNGKGWVVHEVVPLDLKEGQEHLDWRVPLRRGGEVVCQVLGVDGQPVPDAVMVCRMLVEQRGGLPLPLRITAGRFTLSGCDPQREYRVLILDPIRRQGAAVWLPGRPEGDEPVVVRLEPCGTLEVQLRDAAGRPQGNRLLGRLAVHLSGDRPIEGGAAKTPDPGAYWLDVRRWDPINQSNQPRTDGDGQCRFTGVIAQVPYTLLRGGPAVQEEVVRSPVFMLRESGATVRLRGTALR